MKIVMKIFVQAFITTQRLKQSNVLVVISLKRDILNWFRKRMAGMLTDRIICERQLALYGIKCVLRIF
jgi:hypothetical protein